MSHLEYPSRIFSLSDCHGGQTIWDPLASPDVAARLAESIRSDLSGVQHFDTFGAPGAYNQRIVGEAVRLHAENPDASRTGLFVNSAARTEEKNNGQPFYRAEFAEHVRVVATPLSVLSGVRDRVTKLLELPNKNNGLYGNSEQHRSSFTPRLLADNHGLALRDIDPSRIPELPAGGTLGYVDRFGNLTLCETGVVKWKSIRERIAGCTGENVKVYIGSQWHYIAIGTSLANAKPGTLVLYENDGNVEILSKWDKSWTTEQRLEKSAYGQFGKPAIGTPFSFEERGFWCGGIG